MVQQIQNLQGWWKLNGSLTDSSSNGNDGIPTSITYTSGKITYPDQTSQAALFNGTSSVIDITPSATLNTQSISFWMYASANNSDILQLASGVKITINGSNVVATSGFTNATIYLNTSSASATASTGAWYLVIVTFDTLDADDIAIGYGGSSYFSGKIADVRLYNKVLTSAEMSAIYINGDGNPTNNRTRVLYEVSGVLSDDVVSSSNIDLTDDTEIDICELNAQHSFVAKIGEEAVFIDEDGNQAFLGIIENLRLDNANGDNRVIRIASYEQQLQERIVDDVFASQTAEAFLETIIETYSDLTFSFTGSTGITIPGYYSQNKSAWDVVKDILDQLLDYTYYVSNRVFYLFKRGSVVSPLSVTNGTDCIILGWDQDKSKQVTVLKLFGDKEVREKIEFQDGDGSTAVFTLQEFPRSLKVEVFDGSEYVLQDPTVDGQTEGVYELDKKTKQVTFASGSEPASGSDYVQFTYLYDVDISLEHEASPSTISTYGRIERDLTKKWITKVSVAIDYAEKYVEAFSTPILNTSVNMLTTLDITSIRPGYTISVTDNENLIDGANVSGEYIIKRIIRNYPSQGIILEIGENRNRFFDFMKENQYRIDQLYEKDNNASIVNKNQTLKNTVNIDLIGEILTASVNTYDSDTWYWQESGGTRNDWKEDGTGDMFLEEGGYSEEPIEVSFLITEDGDNLITEGGDTFILD